MNFKVVAHIMHLYAPSKPEFYRHIDIVLGSKKFETYKKFRLALFDFHLMGLDEFERRLRSFKRIWS